MNKILRIASIATPLVLTAGTAGTYLIVASKKSKDTQQVNEGHLNVGQNVPEKDLSKYFDVFPKLDQHDFYNDIRIRDADDYEESENKNANKLAINGMKIVIDNEMKAKIVNYILRHLKTTDGNIYYGVESVNSHFVKFHFKWERTSDDVYYKTYEFSLSDSTK